VSKVTSVQNAVGAKKIETKFSPKLKQWNSHVINVLHLLLEDK